MSFTPGPWWIAPPIFDGDVIYASPQIKGRRNEVIAMGIGNKADARLIAAAPEMVAVIKEFLWGDETFSREFPEVADDLAVYTIGAVQRAEALLRRIDGEGD